MTWVKLGKWYENYWIRSIDDGKNHKRASEFLWDASRQLLR